MRPQSILLLTLALGCGLVASIGISQVMDRNKQPAAASTEMEPIFVAMTDIPFASQLTAENIKLEEWPKSKVPKDAVTKLDQIDGKRCRVKMYAGEPILSGKLAGANELGGVTNDIPAGYRVVAVRVDAVSGSGSLIVPGDRVDVLVFLNRNPSTGVTETSAKTLLQDISVFAVDTLTATQRKGDKEEPVAAKTISLLVTPTQAQKVTLASELGTIRLVLRGPNDTAASNVPQLNVGDIFGNTTDSKADRKAEAGPPPSTTLAKGLVDWLNKQKDATAANVAKQVAIPTAAPTHFKMQLLLGPELKEIDFTNGALAAAPEPAATTAPAADATVPTDNTEVAPTPEPPLDAPTDNATDDEQNSPVDQNIDIEN